MKSIFENLINGNLTSAKNSSRGYSYAKLKGYATDELGMDENKATAAALYLKGKITFQKYCEAQDENYFTLLKQVFQK